MIDDRLSSTNNLILSGLDAGERERIAPHLVYHTVELGDHLFHSGDQIDYLFFPDHSMVSVVGRTPQGQSAEIGIIGKEGVAGIDLLLGIPTAPNDMVIQLADGGYHLLAAEALREFRLGGPFQTALLHFTQRLITQIGQTAVCNAIHAVEERLGRWLLMCRDRSKGDTFYLTQEFLSFMVGTTRASVTLAAITLQDLGLITYKRGSITISDRPGLIDFACDCYRIVRI